MIELEIKNLSKYYGANLIFEDINFDVQTKERVAIVGRNGCGKSTIFKIISGKEYKDKGDILIRKGSKIGYLEQIPKFENLKVKEILNLGFPELIELEYKLRSLEEEMQNVDCEIEKTLETYSKLQLEYENLGGYNKETAISKVCNGLNITERYLNLYFDNLSGGEKTRVILGKILIENPNVLLLDEPTNHLDMKSVEWLENYLKDYDGCVIIISHDRYFLDRVVTKVVEIESLVSKSYIGNYSSYIIEKEENIELMKHKYKEQQKKINEMEESIKQLKVFSRNGLNEKFVKRAQSMQKRLDKMDKMDKPYENNESMKINIINDTKQSQDVISISEGRKSFNDKILFENVDILIRKGEKVALIGENGCGKSTFLKIVLQSEELDEGVLKVAGSSKIGYLPQNIEFENEEMTVLQWFREDINILEGKAREYLAKYMFYSEDVFKKVKTLSGGQKSRLKLSKILYFDINLLILDEPTNHLDIDSIKDLENVLRNFTGSILFVSHDRYFINTICERVLSIEDNSINNYNGDYDYYKNKREENEIFTKCNDTTNSKSKEKSNKETKNIEQEIVKNNSRQKSNSKGSASKNIINNRYKLDKLEKEIEDLEMKLKRIDMQIEEVTSDYEKLEILNEERVALEKELNELLCKWVEV